MALALASRAGRLLGLHRTVSGSWLQGHLSTSAMLSQTSKSPSENDTKIYEMRTYYVKPKAFADFMKLTNEYIHLKSDTNSKLNGYWTSDIGGLNEVTHIWEYDSYAQRAEARKALSQDETWINNYIKKILKMLVKQDNLVMNAAPWFDVKPPLSTGGVYELRMYDLVLGKKEQWEHRLVQGLPDRCKLSEPVGLWFTEFGHLNRAIMLWSYQSLDDRIRIRKEAQEIEEWVETIRDCLPFETRAFSKVLIPTEFSPWR